MSSWFSGTILQDRFADTNYSEYSIDYSGNSAEIESSGVRINMIPRNGGNTWAAHVFGSFSTPDLQSNISAPFCSFGSGYLTQIKLLGSYTFPYDIVFGGTLQSIPSPERGAIVTYSSDAIAASLGRPLAAGGTIDINITPTAIMPGRLAKFAFQYNFQEHARRLPARTTRRPEPDLGSGLYPYRTRVARAFGLHIAPVAGGPDCGDSSVRGTYETMAQKVDLKKSYAGRCCSCCRSTSATPTHMDTGRLAGTTTSTSRIPGAARPRS